MQGLSLEAGEYSGLSGHRWITREIVAGQAGPQGRRQARHDGIMMVLEEIVEHHHGGGSNVLTMEETPTCHPSADTAWAECEDEERIAML